MRTALSLFALLALAAWAPAQGSLQPPPAPLGNPVTPEKALLGKTLFWDEQLSATKTVACGTCHVPGRGGSDPRTSTSGPWNPGPNGVFGDADDVAGSPGVIRNLSDGTYVSDPQFALELQVTGRKTPSMINAAYFRELFWDGRARDVFTDPLTGAVVLNNRGALESQSIEPPLSDVEMAHEGMTWSDLASRIEGFAPLAMSPQLTPDLDAFVTGRSYPELFEDAFGTQHVTPTRVAMAIATYERTLYSDETPWDDLQNGNGGALTQQEQRGRNLFAGRARCNNCHSPPLMSDQSYEYIGVRPQNEDLGRGGVTGIPQDNGRMKVPSLRNVELRAPYFHNGRFETLEEVVDFYNRGGDFNGPNKSNDIRNLNLNPGERADLVAFLRRPLTDPRVRDELPPFDRPMLYSESNQVPELFGTATAHSSGVAPRLIAVEPPKIGNETFTVAVEGGTPGMGAAFVVDHVENPSGTSIFGVDCYLGLTQAASPTVIGPLAGSGPGGGYGSVVLAIPPHTNLIGQEFYGQWIVTDPGAPQGYAATEAVRLRIF